MKKFLVSVLAIPFLFCGFAFAKTHSAQEAVYQNILVEPVANLSEDFMRGVDVSYLYEIEANGGKYYNHQGQEEDLFKILVDNGVNWVRFRVWNKPVNGGGSNSVDVDIPMAKHAKDAGLKVLVDFHYSDSWADPAKQVIPADWKNLSEKQLNAAVEKFTKESIEKFTAAGARPDAVQIGNELNNGFMWPMGKIWGDAGEKVGGMDSFVGLLKSASKGVRSAQGSGDKIKIIIHLADGGNNDLYRSVFDPVTQGKVDFDIIGLSFYTYWHGSTNDLKKNMTDLSKRYGKELAVVETAYGFTKEDGDDQGNVFMVFSEERDGYLPTVQGQATAVRDVIATVSSVKGGCGVFYWEPAWIPVKGAGLSKTEGDSWENQCMFDFKGNVLPSMAVWNLVYGNDRGAVTNKWGGSAKSGSGFTPYDIADPIKVITMPGIDPILPKMIKVVFTNDKEIAVIASWEKHDWANEKTPRTVKIQAGLSGSTYKVPAEVEISSRVNLVADNSFESGKLGNWKLNGSDEASFMENNKGNAHTGKWTYKYWLGTGFKSVLTQDFKGLENGTYIASIWAMGGGGENDIRLLATNFDKSNTKRVLSAKITNTGWCAWKKYEFEIPVTNGQATIGIYLDTTAGNWGNFDDIEFFLAEPKDKAPKGDDSAAGGFSIDVNKDMTAEAVAAPVVQEGGATGPLANIKTGLWIETTSDTNAIIRDIATGEKSGYEVDNQHLKSNANWWFWGDINKDFHLDAEISLWNFDRTLYQSNSYAANTPTVTWGDGFQSLGEMLFSPINGANDETVGSLNKMAFAISSPYVNTKFGYGNLKDGGMSEFTGIYNVLDRWLDVGKGFTEISNGKNIQKFGDVKINALAALSQMRGTYGMYDIVDVKFGENYQVAATFGSVTTSEQLFYYNEKNTNAVSLYLNAQPAEMLKVEAHGLSTFGTDVDSDSSAIAGAVRVTYKDSKLKAAVKGSYAGEHVNSVWGSDGQTYDDINADTVTGKLDVDYDVTGFLYVGLDETLTLNDVDALSDGLVKIRTQPKVDFDLGSLTDIGLKFSTYGVLSVDRLAKSTSTEREIIPYFNEAGIEIEGKDLARYLRKIIFDYAVSADYAAWESGNSYEQTVFYNSFMVSTDITDNLNVHAGAIYRDKAAEDATYVPFGFSMGLKFARISLPGRPAFWTHFCYGMNPYSDNNYSLYRADNWMNKAPHRTYLLNDLYEDYNTSQISLGLIWDLK